ncbi:42157_t:CDS:2, partial [Gigaspora margarita]
SSNQERDSENSIELNINLDNLQNILKDERWQRNIERIAYPIYLQWKTETTEKQKYKLAQNKITYLSTSKIQETYDVSAETLRRWAASGKLAIIKTPRGKQLYSVTDAPEFTQKAKVCYARVSSEHQQDDLERQIADLQHNYPGYEIIRGFLLFWNEYTLEESKKWWLPKKTDCWIFEKNGTWLVVFGSDICANDNETGELAEDLVTVFVVRQNGLRSAANRKRRKEAAQAIQKFQEESNETSSRQGTTHSPFSHSGVTNKTQEMDRNSSMDIQSMPYRLKKKPSDIRDEAMNDLLKGYDSNFAAECTNFKMKFHSKKDPQQSIAILSKYWGRSRGEYSFLHKMNSAESLPKQLGYNSRLVMNRL